MKWINKCTFIDTETGEILNIRNKQELKHIEFYIINKFKQYYEDEQKGTNGMHFTYECRRKPIQCKIF